MMKIKPLSPKQLCIKCNPKQLNFRTTAELSELNEPVGQERAMAAIEFGIHIQENGYNLYLLGPEGTGKHHIINSVLRHQARLEPPADDWCYVQNFDDPKQPLALRLPAGMGPEFKKNMADLVEKLQASSFPAGSFPPAGSGPRNESRGLTPEIRSLLDQLGNQYHGISTIGKYLTAVEADIIKNLGNLEPHKYEVNVLVSHAPDLGAPVVYENHPSLSNLIGRMEHQFQNGALVPDFTLIRPGALHYANGGYLILDAQQLLSQPYAWDSLKRVLFTNHIKLETTGEVMGLTHATASLDPEPIPLKIKIILLGDRPLYYSLTEHDQHFADLFKVAADFSNHIPRTSANFLVFSRLIATIVKKENLLPLNRHAVARVIDQSARLANDTQRLFTHMRYLVDLLRESNYWARQHHHKIIQSSDIQTAIDQQVYRANRIETRIHADFERNILLIDTKGKKIGQINGLSVLQMGNYSFGSPSRITATVRLGKGEIIDIEREVELGGSLHSKGVFILSGFISGRYLVNQHLSISASLVFEQNYGEVEGDSASAAELAALLSAIAKLPLKQSFAITGSVNQYGKIQPIGNVNEKIEGFYSICRAKGFSRRQGVIIPASNVQHLMLKDEVVEAAKRKLFFIYGVETIDEVMTILTGLPAGKPNKKGHFPADTVNGYIEKHLLKYAENADGNHKNDNDNE
jgi:lon-related putative ATP-dependent protease